MRWETHHLIFKRNLKTPCYFHHCQHKQEWQDLSQCIKDLSVHSPRLVSCRKNVWQSWMCGCQACTGPADSSSGEAGGDASLGLSVTGGGSSISPWGTVVPAVAHQAGFEVGTLGTCLSVAVEEDYCHLEGKKKVFLYNDRGWERAKSFGFFSVLLQSGAMCSQSEESVLPCDLFSHLHEHGSVLGMLRNPFFATSTTLASYRKGDKEGPAVTNAGVLQTARKPLQLFFFLPWFWKAFRLKHKSL